MMLRRGLENRLRLFLWLKKFVGGSMAKKKKEENLLKWSELIVWCYLAAMLGIYPLFYRNNYADIATAKYLFFRLVTVMMLLYLLVTQACSRLFDDKKERQKLCLSLLDRLVLLYGIAVGLSWCLSSFRAEGLIGSDGWYMGLLSQILFIGIYFAVSRFGTRGNWPLWVSGVSSFFAFLVAYLNRFNIDPLGMYAGFTLKKTFLGVIGQATLYSSYVTVILAAAMGLYMTTDWERQKRGWLARTLTAALLLVGFGSGITQSSDSFYLGMGVAFVFFLWFAMGDLKIWKRYLETGMMAAVAAGVTGIVQKMCPERVLGQDPLSVMVTQSNLSWFALGVVAVCYAGACLAGKWYDKKRPPALPRMIRRFRVLFFTVLLLAVLFLPVLIWLVTTGRVGGNFGALQESGYMVFDHSWGNGRGTIWMHAARVFSDYSPLRKLVGCGPDVFIYHTLEYYAEFFQEPWGALLGARNAHNEWLTAFVDYGVIGGTLYLGVFLTALAGCVRSWKKEPVLLAFGAAVAAYMGHNISCYQQVVCTPLIFIIMGTAEYLIRRQSP